MPIPIWAAGTTLSVTGGANGPRLLATTGGGTLVDLDGDALYEDAAAPGWSCVSLAAGTQSTAQMLSTRRVRCHMPPITTGSVTTISLSGQARARPLAGPMVQLIDFSNVSLSPLLLIPW